MTADSAPRATRPAEVTNAAAFLHAATVGGHLEMDEHAEANGGVSVRYQLDPLCLRLTLLCCGAIKAARPRRSRTDFILETRPK